MLENGIYAWVLKYENMNGTDIIKRSFAEKEQLEHYIKKHNISPIRICKIEEYLYKKE